MERSSWVLQYGNQKIWFFFSKSSKLNLSCSYFDLCWRSENNILVVLNMHLNTYMSTSGMHRRSFEGRHLVFQLCFIMLKMKLYVCRNFKLVWKFQTNWTKNEEVIAYTSWVVRHDRVQPFLPPRSPGLQAREGRGWGNGPMYWFFLCKLSNAILTKCLSCNSYAKETGVPGHQTSVTHQTSWREITKYVPPPSWSELTLLSGNSKVDYTGLKLDNLRNHWAYIAVFGLILKWKSHAIA